MINGSSRTLEDLEEELRILQARLTAVEQKRSELMAVEGEIRTDMQRVRNKIERLKEITKYPID